MKLIIMYIFFWSVLSVNAQPLRLGGIITDAQGDPLEGASVVLTPASLIEISDAHGSFTFRSIARQDYTLTISMAGYEAATLEIKPVNRDTAVHIVLIPSVHELKAVTVISNKKLQREQQESLNIEVVSQQYIRKHLGGSLMQTLSRLPGISTIGIGSGQSKPLIRGMGFNRVVVVDKGIKHESQQWGADHGLEMDQFATGDVEIVKGAASFLYGSDAISGIIDVKEEHLSDKETISGALNIVGKSNNGLYGTSFHIKGKTGKWVYGGRITYQNYGDYRVPADTVYVYSYAVPLYKSLVRNTAGRELNAHAYGGYVTDRFQSVLYLDNSYGKSGFFANAHGLEPRRVNTTLHDASSRDMHLPYQQVNHFKAISRNVWQTDHHRMEVDAGYQHNFRQEYSQYINHGYMPPLYPDTINIPENLERQYDKQVYSFNIRDKFRAGKHRFAVGVNGEHQNNRISGWSFLIPAFTQYAGGLFLYDKYELNDKILLHAAVRYDHALLKTSKYTDWFQSDVPDENGVTTSNFLVRAESMERTFNSLVWSVGANYNTSNLFLKANIGKSFRIPIPKELAANGVNYHYFSYEKGSPSLSPEQSYQIDLGINWMQDDFSFSFSPFYNYFTNYIYLNPTPRHDHFYGAGNQVFEYAQSQVQRLGGEFQFRYKISKKISMELLGEYIHSKQLSGGKKGYTLPFSPPPSMLLNATWQPGGWKWFYRTYVSVDWRVVLPQHRIIPPEKRTSGYGIINLQAGSQIGIQNRPVQINLQIQNLFNRKYMEHTSFYRLIEMPETGRNIVLTLSVPFSINRTSSE